VALADAVGEDFKRLQVRYDAATAEVEAALEEYRRRLRAVDEIAGEAEPLNAARLRAKEANKAEKHFFALTLADLKRI